MALRACIDAGEQNGVYAIAAVAYGHDRAVKANKQWEAILNGRPFHMTDLHARKRAFDGISGEESDAITRGVVSTINRHASYAMCVSCNIGDIADSLPSKGAKYADIDALLHAFRSPYGFLCHFLMMAVGTRVQDAAGGQGRHISYVFEKGDDGQSGLKRYLEYLGDEQHHRLYLDGYSLKQMVITPKEKIEGIFHSSDLLAWEWARHVDRQRQGHPMRKSLAALIGGVEAEKDKFGMTLSDGKRFFCRHFNGERMAAITAYFSESLMAENEAALAKALSRYRDACPRL